MSRRAKPVPTQCRACGAVFDNWSYNPRKSCSKKCQYTLAADGISRTRGRPSCGTDAGYQWHLRNNDTPCGGCHSAHLEVKRESWWRHRQENLERNRERRALRDPDVVRAERAAKYQSERERAIAKAAEWRSENPGLYQEQLRRAYRKRAMSSQAATRHGEPYSPAEDAVLLGWEHSRAELAYALGRSLLSIDYRQRELRKRTSQHHHK